MLRKVVIILFSLLLVILTASSDVKVDAQWQYHLDHEWAKIWINQDQTIDLLYNISITLDSGPNINYVLIGQPQRDFTIGTAKDQYGHALTATDKSSGSDYRVQVDLHSPLTVGQTIWFTLITNVAHMICEDTQNPCDVGIQFIPTWWSDANVMDLRVLIVFPIGVSEDMVRTSVNWNDTLYEDDRLAIHWEKHNLLPNEQYPVDVYFPKEYVQYFAVSRVHNLNTDLNYITIQMAIDAPDTLDGHTIFVEEGTYCEHVVVDKSLSLIGENRDTTIIADNGTGTVVSLTSQNISISNFTIMNAGFEPPISGAILLNETSNCKIENVVVLDNDPCGITLFNSTNNKVSSSELFNNTWALILVNSYNNTIVKNVISENSHGIGLGGPAGSSHNLLTDNQISESIYYGIDIFGFDNKVSSNQILNNSKGVLLDMANNNFVVGNNISNNLEIGIYLMRGSENNTIIENTIQSNHYGIFFRMDSGNNNTFYHNIFENNDRQVYSSDSTNIWNDDYPFGGNYWSDYTGVDSNNDGIGDTTHIIDAENIDNYPLIGMFSSFNVTSEYHVLTICNSSISDFQFNGTAILFDVSGENNTAGFCRICIPKALMNETYRVFVNGTEVEYTSLADISNITHNHIYFTYNHSTQEITIVPEFPSFLILPLFMIATLLAVIMYRWRHTK